MSTCTVNTNVVFCLKAKFSQVLCVWCASKMCLV